MSRELPVTGLWGQASPAIALALKLRNTCHEAPSNAGGTEVGTLRSVWSGHYSLAKVFWVVYVLGHHLQSSKRQSTQFDGPHVCSNGFLKGAE